MKNILKLSLVFTLSLILVNCSSDDDNTPVQTIVEIPNSTNNNVITVNNNTYEINSIVIEESLGKSFITIFNKEENEIIDAIFNGTSNLSDVNYFSILINTNPLQEQTYNFSQMSFIDFKIDAEIIDSDTENGTTIITDDSDPVLEATDATFQIERITSDEIEFTFQFTRNDGTIINGAYNGSFLFLD